MTALAWLDKGEIAPGEQRLEICDGVGCGGCGHYGDRHPRTRAPDDGLVPWCYRCTGFWEHADEHACSARPPIDPTEQMLDANGASPFDPIVGYGTGEPMGIISRMIEERLR